MAKRLQEDYLSDIIEHASHAESFIRGVDLNGFRSNLEKIFAVTAPWKLSAKQPITLRPSSAPATLTSPGKTSSVCAISSFMAISAWTTMSYDAQPGKMFPFCGNRFSKFLIHTSKTNNLLYPHLRNPAPYAADPSRRQSPGRLHHLRSRLNRCLSASITTNAWLNSSSA